MTFKHGDKVRVYDHIGGDVPDGVEGTYDGPWGARHSVNIGSGYGGKRIFGRVEKVDDVVESFKKGDKVLVDDADFNYQQEVAINSSNYYVYGYATGIGHMVHTPAPKSAPVSVKRVRKFEEALESYKQRVLKVLDEKNDKYKWCDEYEQTLKALDITRPLPDLPTGKNALIEVRRLSGDLSRGNITYRRSNKTPNSWVDGAGVLWSDAQAQKRYVRTIFEGEK